MNGPRWRSVSSTALLLGFAAGCGGNTASNAATAGDAASGASGDLPRVSGPAGDQGTPLPDAQPEPSHLSITLGGKLSEGTGTPSRQRCFQGFDAVVEGYRLELEAFVFEPGVYTGDPVKILYLAITPPASVVTYIANTAQVIGSLTLRATAISPRFQGSVSATLLEAGTPGGAELEVDDLEFDIEGASESCL